MVALRSREIDAFLARPGPEAVPEPERLDRFEEALADAGGARPATPGGGVATATDREVVHAFAAEVGTEVADVRVR